MSAAGQSAEREFERRHARDRRVRRAVLPMLLAVPVLAAVGYAVGERFLPGMGLPAAIVLGIVAFKSIASAILPQASTIAWARGADGERRVAGVLDGMSGWRSLHDRLMPGSSRANIDHVTVGPGGVFTVDAKRYQGRLTVARDGTIRVKDRDCTKLLDQARRQAAAVTGLLSGGTAAVPVLCFVGTELPRRHLEVEGVHLVRLRALSRFLGSQPAVLSPVRAAAVAAQLDAALRAPGQPPARKLRPAAAAPPAAPPPAQLDSGVTVSRWTRHGHDRVYVNRDGARLGYLDLKTGHVTVESEADRPTVELAVAGWQGAGGTA